MAMFLFVGSIGVGIFSKVCPEDGVNISYFVPGENECCKREAQQKDCGDCCASEHEKPADDCCDISVELVKVKLDFLNDFQVKAVIFTSNEVQPVWVSEAIVPVATIFTASGSDPPPIQGRDRLVDFQQWLI